MSEHRPPLLAVDRVTRRYALPTGNYLTVLERLSFTLERGEFLAVTGVSGVGKSTLLNLLGLLDRPDEGDIRLDGVSYRTLDHEAASRFRNQRIGFVFQYHHLLPEFTLLENVMMPLRIDGKPLPDGVRRARHILEIVRLHDRLDHFPSMLSGGEQQRAAIARALINDPDLLLMDEPTGNLDPETGDRVMNHLENLKKQRNFGCIMVTHNMHLASRCDRIFPMSRKGDGHAGEVLR